MFVLALCLVLTVLVGIYGVAASFSCYCEYQPKEFKKRGLSATIGHVTRTGVFFFQLDNMR